MASTGNQGRARVARYVLVHDPNDDWPRDHFFNRVPFEEGLDEGHWPSGSIWRVEHSQGPNHHIIIRGAILAPQKAVKYKGPINRHRLNS